jgi:hypothetical protein
LCNEEKKSYIQNIIPHQETIQPYFEGTQVLCLELVDKVIEEHIIGEMHFHPEDEV